MAGEQTQQRGFWDFFKTDPLGLVDPTRTSSGQVGAIPAFAKWFTPGGSSPTLFDFLSAPTQFGSQFLPTVPGDTDRGLTIGAPPITSREQTMLNVGPPTRDDYLTMGPMGLAQTAFGFEGPGFTFPPVPQEQQPQQALPQPQLMTPPMMQLAMAGLSGGTPGSMPKGGFSLDLPNLDPMQQQVDQLLSRPLAAFDEDAAARRLLDAGEIDSVTDDERLNMILGALSGIAPQARGERLGAMILRGGLAALGGSAKADKEQKSREDKARERFTEAERFNAALRNQIKQQRQAQTSQNMQAINNLINAQMGRSEMVQRAGGITPLGGGLWAQRNPSVTGNKLTVEQEFGQAPQQADLTKSRAAIGQFLGGSLDLKSPEKIIGPFASLQFPNGVSGANLIEDTMTDMIASGELSGIDANLVRAQGIGALNNNPVAMGKILNRLRQKPQLMNYLTQLYVGQGFTTPQQPQTQFQQINTTQTGN